MACMKVNCYLKKLMEDKSLTQLALAEATGLAPSTIGRLYRNQLTLLVSLPYEEKALE